jgi:hypothetical protein
VLHWRELVSPFRLIAGRYRGELIDPDEPLSLVVAFKLLLAPLFLFFLLLFFISSPRAK